MTAWDLVGLFSLAVKLPFVIDRSLVLVLCMTHWTMFSQRYTESSMNFSFWFLHSSLLIPQGPSRVDAGMIISPDSNIAYDIAYDIVTKISYTMLLSQGRDHQGEKRPTPTQSTCLYYYHDNEASKCVTIMMEHISFPIFAGYFVSGAPIFVHIGALGRF